MTGPAPRVSVLMTAYNRADYVGAAIESVLAQTWPDFELIVSDDHSTDATVDIVREYAARDRRIRLSINDRNLGDYPNRNAAASLARGEFLKYHDSDDLMYPHCLATMVEPMIGERRAAIALSGSRSWPGGACPMLLTPKLAYEREFLGHGLFHLGPGAALFRTDVFRELGGFSSERHVADYLFWIRACARVNILLVPGDLFYYRVHAAQELALRSQQEAAARASGVAWRMLNSSECPLAGRTLEQAKRNYVFTAARGAYRQLRGGRPALAASIIRHAGVTPVDVMRYLRLPHRSPCAGTPHDS